jgi:hypothetical protein
VPRVSKKYPTCFLLVTKSLIITILQNKESGIINEILTADKSATTFKIKN